MAVNDIENPEEGTPRSRKDIRRERRQMRSINAYRAEMGEKDPYYTRKEIREVGKPFKAQSSTFMTGTKDGTTYNDPSLLDKPDEIKQVEYIKYEPGGYSTNVKPMSKETFEKEKKEGRGAGYKDYDEYLKTVTEKYTVPTTETRATLSLDQYKQIEEGTPNGQALANTLKNTAINDDTKTFEQKKNLVDVANVAGKELETTNEQINQQAKQEINTALGGSGKNVAEVMEKAPTQYDWTLSEGREYTPTSIDDINAQASQAKKKAPQLVIEKLGVQDYYPEIGRDIAVGNFSGSYAGSRTIFSGAGGLLPLGLYDARKRAIAAEIKRKEAIMDQIKEIPDIAKQFKTEFSQIYMNDFLAPWVNAYKDNPDALMSNTDFLKDMAHYKSVAENFLKVDSDLKKFKELVDPKDGKPTAYATPGMLEIAHKFLSGFLPGETKSWLTGKKNISKITETVQAIPNGYNWADDKVKVLLEKGQAEIPIYPKDGVEWNSMTEKDKEQIKKDVNGLVVSLQDGSPDYETYLTSLKKYFYFDFETIADEWIKGNSLNALTPKEKEEYKKSLAIYMLKQMPPASIINKIDTVSNKAAERENAQLDYQASMARIQADKEMFYATYNQHSSLTRSLYEGMKRLGNPSESFAITGGEPTDKDGLKMEWEVWDAKENKYRYVKGSDIMNSEDRYYESQAQSIIPFASSFVPEKTVYVVPTENHMINQGGNYNLSTYGNAYKSMRELADGAKEASAPINVKVRTPYQTAFDKNGKFNDGVIGSADAVIGSKYERIAGRIYSGGGSQKVGGYNFQSTREPVNP